jgi:hypothetical protein
MIPRVVLVVVILLTVLLAIHTIVFCAKMDTLQIWGLVRLNVEADYMAISAVTTIFMAVFS